MTRRLRVGMSGIRGVPANFGGSETAVQEIGLRLARGGDEVIVYCRRHTRSAADTSTFFGMRRVVLPSLNTFNFDTLSHSFVVAVHALVTRQVDVIHFHGMGNALLLPLFRLSPIRTVVTIDGADWERPKWGPVARLALKLSARIAVRFADHVIIDNRPSLDYFRRRFGYDATYVPYGADRSRPTSTGYLKALGLRPRSYVLFVGALVPDKGPDMLVKAYRDVQTDMPLVVVGDSPFAPEFRRQLRLSAARDPRVRMLGYVYGERYRELVAHAYAYAHPLRSDGTSPALLQAMAYGSCIVVNSLPEALSAVGDAALPFARDDSADLARRLSEVIDTPLMADELRQKALVRAEAEYDWDRVAAQHREIYEGLAQ